MSPIVDQYGRSLSSGPKDPRLVVSQLKRQLRAKYDAAQTIIDNQNHWANADNLSPHSVASLSVRRKLRSRSRYEVIENNPYLKGTVLTVANDFVGSGPKLQINDKRLSKARRQQIEARFMKWSKGIKLRQKLWRMRVAKITDGETFLRVFNNKRKGSPMTLDFQVLEADRISSSFTQSDTTGFKVSANVNEIDGVRFDNFEQPVQYHILNSHPGGSLFFEGFFQQQGGQWVDKKFIIHWFRQDRGWLRGIPETTPSLPLCAILRRYTLAQARHAETQADFTAIIETEGPASTNPWTDGAGTQIEDDPFDVFPIEMGMIANLPWGYKLKQLQSVPLGFQYDEFVGALLREIIRPILVPFNIAVGTSKDSNMASANVDQHIYRGGQHAERLDCQDFVLDEILQIWWEEAIRIPGFLGDDLLVADQAFRDEPPEHLWRWDKVGLDHTDPVKVAKALETLHNKRFITDRDIQEQHHNRDLETWRADIKEDDEFRKGLVDIANPGGNGQEPANGPNAEDIEDLLDIAQD